MRLLALTAVRPGEVRHAVWSEFTLDGDDPVWVIPAERMKVPVEHAVPLSKQAVEVIQACRRFAGRGDLLFPSSRAIQKPMSENALSYMCSRAGLDGLHVPHGWRATFSTIMNEMFPEDRFVIDLMLAHTPKDKVESAYNRATRWARRRELAQRWADMVMEGLQLTANLLELPRK